LIENILFSESQLLEHCMACCYHENTAIVAAASEMLVGIVADKQRSMTLCSEDSFRHYTDFHAILYTILL